MQDLKECEKLYGQLLKDYNLKEKRLKKILKQSDAQTKELLRLNEKLEQAANTDPMTGAYNRRYFYETARHMLSLARREHFDVMIVILDIDKFKNINDTYGHDVGDIIIKDLSSNIASTIRESDIFARFGGEEFVILLNNIDEENSIKFCNKLRLHIQDSKPYKDIQYTVSVGIGKVFDKDNNNVDYALKRADLALYAAKESGRNKVIYFNESILHA